MLNLAKKLVTKKAAWVAQKNYPQVEIRTTHKGAQLLVVVSSKGAEVKDYECRTGNKWGGGKTEGTNVRVSSKAAMNMTLEEFDQLHKTVHEAYREVQEEYVMRGL